MSEQVDVARELQNALARLGLSATPVLGSTGAAQHGQRLRDGLITATTLAQYAEDLRRLSAVANQGGVVIPLDYWDVCTPAMRAAGLDDYRLVHLLAQPDYRPYVRLLGVAYRRLLAARAGETTAVAAALDILRDITRYLAAGHVATMVPGFARLPAAHVALSLWQQITTGTSRRAPIIGWEVPAHGLWGRFNVATMWRFAHQTNDDIGEIWGVSGFDDGFVRDPQNSNQVEHMTLSAVMQAVYHVPLALLTTIEYGQWLLQSRTSRAEAQADSALNHAIARDFLPYFTLADPERACDRLRLALGQSPAR